MLGGVQHDSKQPAVGWGCRGEWNTKIYYLKIKSFGDPGYSLSHPQYIIFTSARAFEIYYVNDDDGAFIFYSSSYKLYKIQYT